MKIYDITVIETEQHALTVQVSASSLDDAEKQAMQIVAETDPASMQRVHFEREIDDVREVEQ